MGIEKLFTRSIKAAVLTAVLAFGGCNDYNGNMDTMGRHLGIMLDRTKNVVEAAKSFNPVKVEYTTTQPKAQYPTTQPENYSTQTP